MAIANSQQELSITNGYLNLPITAGISHNGYWYTYLPANANNTSLGAAIKPYKWGSALPLAGGNANMTIEGSYPLIIDPWDGANVSYYGGCIEWIGPGQNDITNEEEDDAFFFAHLGTLSTAPDDQTFYWDRAYEPFAGTDWYYYQYHAHSPTTYTEYENGREVIGARGFIDSADKAFGYMLNVKVRVSSVNYSSVFARVHTPSVGGAHNSHNDQILPSVSNKDYMPGGILRGIGERFHAFYITANGTEWDVFCRTYTDALSGWTSEVTVGTYDLADPNFNPSSNIQNSYPVRASMGTSFGTKIYFPVILNNSVSGFDLEIWSFDSLDTISSGSLTRQVLASGLASRPDSCCAVVGTTALYVLRTDVANGGCRLHSYNGTTWTDEGAFLTNNASDPIRVHGFEFNSEDFKYYALLSGTASGGASTYVGPGMYSFELTGTFTGYKHLDFDATNYQFVVKDPLTSGYVKYTTTTSQLSRINAIEPQAIGSDIRVLDYDNAGTNFFNRKSLSLGSGIDEFYFHSIVLSNGRKFGAGQVVNNPGNLGPTGSGDLLFSIFTPDLNSGTHFAYGGSGDDYITGCYQGADGKIWLTGYSKSELVPKGEIRIHGWVRNLNDGGSTLMWRDLTIDSLGNVYMVGAHDDGYIVIAKYNKNYDIQWQKILGAGGSPDDVGYGITVDSNDEYIYVAGETNQAGAGSTDALLCKISTSDGSLSWAKVYGTVNADSAKSVCVINNGGTDVVVMAVVTGTSTTFLAVTTAGVISEQNTYTNLVVNKVRPNQSTPTAGRFLFAGNNGGGTSQARFGMCELNSSISRMVQWVGSYTGASSINALDIANTEAATGGLDAGYVICGSNGSKAMLLKVLVDESSGTYTVTKDWSKNVSVAATYYVKFTAMCVSPYTDTTRYIWVAGSTDKSDIPSMGMQEGYVARYQSSDGTQDWQNVFGHDMDEEFTGIVNDTTGLNFITSGWSMSHSDSMDAILFRGYKEGWGTGTYYFTETGTAPYYYLASALTTASDVDTFASVTAPSDNPGSLAADSYSPTYDTSDYTSREYDGGFGPNGLFTFFMAYIDPELLQAYQNTATFRETNAGCSAINYLSDWTLIGKMWQAATVGDGTADDGNMFGYDIIEASDGLIWAIGQTSGDVTMTNLGLSGAYDYLLVELDPVTEELEFYQNGTSLDEETYALCELENGKIAFTGRTTGNLGGDNQGGYDIFLGIWDPATETADYYNVGSGLDDVGLNVHDLGNNELAVVYASYGGLGDQTNLGSQDIGLIKFNYSTDTWGNAYQTGSSTSEIFVQNGKPSAILDNGRIAIVASSTGLFADNAITYGYLDVILAIWEPESGTFRKYQIGTPDNEFGSSCSKNGEFLLIGGYAGGSFDGGTDAIFVEFDAVDTYAGKSSSI